MSFPNDIKGCIKDCILTILWPKQDIYTFFSDHGCTKADLKCIANFKDESMTRSRIIDVMFGYLSAKPTGGLGQFRSMLQSLLKWSHFDPYYFDKLKKLDRSTAEKSLNHLRQLQEIRDAKIIADREKRDAAEKLKQHPQTTLPALRELFLDLHSGKLNAQNRGYALESILGELAKLENLELTEPFKVMGEQIDGAVKYDGEHYLLEAKWQEKEASNEPVYQFVGKIEGKMYGRGIFVSINGFSENVARTIVFGKAIKTIFVDGEDLVLVLEGHLSFTQMLDHKIKAAQTKGLIYINPISGTSKI